MSFDYLPSIFKDESIFCDWLSIERDITQKCWSMIILNLKCFFKLRNLTMLIINFLMYFSWFIFRFFRFRENEGCINLRKKFLIGYTRKDIKLKIRVEENVLGWYNRNFSLLKISTIVQA